MGSASGGRCGDFRVSAHYVSLQGLIVDELWVSVGSTNFDSRSFKLNDEANLNVYNQQFAERQLADFKVDLTRAKRITFQDWENRPMARKNMGIQSKNYTATTLVS